MNRTIGRDAAMQFTSEFPSLVGRSHECDYPAEVTALPCCTRPRIDVSGSSREIDTLVKSTLANALSIYEVFDDVLERGSI